MVMDWLFARWYCFIDAALKPWLDWLLLRPVLGAITGRERLVLCVKRLNGQTLYRAVYLNPSRCPDDAELVHILDRIAAK